uniref:DUF3592 domain-containing protein n=1 Tax=Geobacter sp. (strain M21) TaxID=443144 RepID=C6DYB0_GEOSM
MEVVERFDLQDKGDHTVVIKTITVKNHHIPLLFLPLIWFVTRFGKPVMPDRLKHLCESTEIPAAIAAAPPGLHGDIRQHTAGARTGYKVTLTKAQPFSLTGILLPLSIIISFGWMLANVITPISAAIVLFNANGYRQAVFTVENLYHEGRRRTGLQWGFSGTVAGTKERFFAPELARGESTSYLALEKRFPKGSKLAVLYNPGVTRDLFQARTIRVLPYNPDFAKQEERRIYWWLKYCLFPFVAVTVIASKLRGKQKGQTPT